MTFNWNDYLQLAQCVYRYGKSHDELKEAAFRCAISRSYYASHCFLRNYAISKGAKISEDGAAHQEVIDFFAKSKDPKRSKIGQHLIHLIQWRTNSDYREHYTITEFNAQICLSKSNEIVKLIQ
ncbi:MAG: hypothetical protein CVV30_01410 [Methanomicrobiales archaeon HGW-Methanomicrobiales-1]|jgi:uncharacterized protein (UPF0332 family)|nr:MAG: hypothetical protein CVV30_01410 [Methanomicrobiales archaeon HGW-Methanomicrobiales-1]